VVACRVAWLHSAVASSARKAANAVLTAASASPIAARVADPLS
jgi:hypothetical protein